MDIETLRPNAPGDNTAILAQYPDSGAHWEKVDETPADEDETYLQQYEGFWTTNYDLYNLPAHSGSGVINSVKVYVRCRYTGVGGYTRVKIKTGGTEYDNGSNLALTGSYAYYSYQWDTNPSNAHPWTWAEIDALQIGLALWGGSYGTVRCTQVYVEVDYTPVVAAGRSFGFIIG